MKTILHVIVFALVFLASGVCPSAEDSSEDLIRFTPSTAVAKRIEGRWKVVVGNDVWLEDFGASEASARKACAIIHFYGLDCLGYIGRPNPQMSYWLSRGRAPAGPFDGEDALKFDPKTVHARRVRDSWKVIDGERWMLDFGDDRGEAERAAAVIQKYGFDHLCFVGRNSGTRPMMYFRTGDTAATRAGPTTAPEEDGEENETQRKGEQAGKRQ